MKTLYRKKYTGISPLDNDTVEIIKNRLFAFDKFYYPGFTRLFFMKGGEKVYMKFKNETLMDHDILTDIHVEFLPDTIDSSSLEVYISFPERIENDILKEWDDVKASELKFILNQKYGIPYDDSSVRDRINTAHKKAVSFMNVYNNQLKNIPVSPKLIKNLKIDHIRYELKLKNPDIFKKFIKNKFSIGASDDIPFIILKTRKGLKVKTNDTALKNKISKNDFTEHEAFLFLVKNSDDRYIFNISSGKLFVHSVKNNLEILSIFSSYIDELKVADIRYSGDLNIVVDTNKLPRLIGDHYSTFFKEKESVRKGNSILLNYTRTITEDIKINIKNSKNGIVTPFVIYNLNSKLHLQYVLDIFQSLVFKSTTTKVAKNFFSFEDEVEVKQKKQANIKKLKSKGAVLDSVKCQKDRQPQIDNERSGNPKKYELVHSGNRYLCNNSPFLYPGFTVDENVCCFKKDQRKKDFYNRLTGNNLNKIKVWASNFVINNKRIIKDEDGNYFHVKKFSPVELGRIVDKNEIKIIKNAGNIWLKRSTMGKILYTNSKDCKNSPKLVDGSYMCKKTGNGNYHFGFTESSIPCCFKEERPTVVSRDLNEVKDPSKYYDNSYIITTDKSIDKNRIGILSEEVNYMLTGTNINSKKPAKNKYFRLGTKLSILKSIKSIKDFELKNVVSKNIFDLSRNSEFKSFSEFKKYVSSEDVDIRKILDFISLHIKTNIILLDFQADDIDECVNIYSKNTKNIFLIKNGGYYEVLVSIEKDGKYKKEFDSQSDLVSNFKKYLKFKCKSGNENSGKITSRDMFKTLKRDGIKISSQVVSKASNKVIFIETRDGVFLPVFPTRGIKQSLAVKYPEDVDIKINKGAFDIFIKKYKKYYSTMEFIKGGVLLNSHLILPTKNDYSDINVKKIAYQESMFKTDVRDKRTDLMKKIDTQRDYYYSLRYTFSRLITRDIKDKIENILKSKETRKTKYFKIKNIVENISSYRNNDSKYITQRLLGVYKKEILEQELAPRKIKMTKINFTNFNQMVNWLKL